MKKLILIFILISLFGCKVKQSSVETIKTFDTTIVTEVLRDSIISIVPYRAEIDGLWVSVDTNGIATLDPIEVSSNELKIKTKIEKGRLYILAETDTLKVPVQLKDKTIDKSHFVDKESVTVKTETYIPKIYIWTFWILWAIVLLGIIRACFWFYKKFFI